MAIDNSSTLLFFPSYIVSSRSFRIYRRYRKCVKQQLMTLQVLLPDVWRHRRMQFYDVNKSLDICETEIEAISRKCTNSFFNIRKHNRWQHVGNGQSLIVKNMIEHDLRGSCGDSVCKAFRWFHTIDFHLSLTVGCTMLYSLRWSEVTGCGYYCTFSSCGNRNVCWLGVVNWRSYVCCCTL